MKEQWIITIGREFCSGGAEIAHKLSAYFGIPYYDKQMIDHTAALLDLNEETVRRHDEKPMGFWEASGYQYSNLWYSGDPSLLLPLSCRVAEAQFDMIRKMADEGPGIFVGRCADYVLRDRMHVLNVFIHAPLEDRIARAMRLYQLDRTSAKKLIVRTDKIRKSYYNNYTHRAWGHARNYDLFINSGRLGTQGAADLIAAFVESHAPESLEKL